jgi:ABC-type lipoprotein release transport system permease subunit
MGVEHTQINSVIPLEESLVEGDSSGAVIGAALAEKLNLHLHENLMINYQDAKAELRTEILPITGIYKFSSKRFQRSHVYTKRETVEKLMGVQGIHRYVLLGENLKEKQLNQLIPVNMLLTHWGELNQEISFSINFQTGLIYFFLIVLGIGISMTILTPIAMVLNERQSEFKMISHLGTTKKRMLVLIIIEAMVMSLGAFLMAFMMATAGFYYLKHTGINLVAARGGADIERGGILLPNIVYPVLQLKQIFISVLFIAFTVLSSYYMASFKLFKKVKLG